MPEAPAPSDPMVSVELPRQRAYRIRARMIELATHLIRRVLVPTVALLDLTEVVRGRSDAGIWALLAATILLAVLVGPSGGTQIRRRAAVLVVGLFTFTVFAIMSFGPLLGAATLLAASVTMTAIYFGRPGVASLLLAMVVVGFTVHGAMSAGWIPFPDPARGDAAQMGNWFRMGLALIIGMGTVGGILAYVFDRFEQTIKHTVLAMQSGQIEREARARAHEALAQSQRMEAVGHLAGGVAHDFNNALVVILGAAEMLRKGLPPDSMEAQLSEDLVGAARNATEITRQLLTLGRRDVTRARSVDVDDALGQVSRAVSRLVSEGIEVEVDARTGVCSWIDPTQLDQVLINLCINARDAMPDGGKLSLRATPMLVEELVRIEVTDQGHGMDEATRKRIFEPFFTTKAEGKGTGLGLATAHDIIDAAGGTIECVSTPGKGTTFRILLPTTGLVSEGPVAKPRVELGRSAKILLVEDRDDVRVLMGEALEEAGHHLIDACDEESALYAMREGRKFDLLCTDAVMPDTDTMAIISRFRETSPNAPILVCSGHVEEDLVRRGIETGRYRYLPKPFTPDELVEVVADVLSRAR